MYNKTIWNSGDIITQEKWDNINNNLSILGAYQLPVTIEVSTFDSSYHNITIHKSYDEIVKLLKQGTICWYYNNLNGTIDYITRFNNYKKQLSGERIFWSAGTEMTSIDKSTK